MGKTNKIRGLFDLRRLDISELDIKEVPVYNKGRAQEIASLGRMDRWRLSSESRYHAFIRAANVYKSTDETYALYCYARALRINY